jgi:CubicO group peptidase (beta-lactamase class C family)
VTVDIPPASLDVSYRDQPGRRAEGFTAVSRILLRGLRAGLPPAAALAVTSPDGTCYRAAGGWANLGYGSPAAVAADAETLFDVASLTKVMVTTPLVLLLHQRRRWNIDDPISRWLPGAPRSPVTIRQCLTHTAGLVSHRPYFSVQQDAPGIRTAVLADLGAAVPGPVCYSDLSFMLLGWAAENCAGQPLDALARTEILGPLGMTRAGFLPDWPGSDRSGFAATEVNGDQRLHDDVIWGEVHDGNAFALGGITGHAGLFAPVGDVELFARALLRPHAHPVLNAATIAEMTSLQATSDAEARGLGWRLKPSTWGRWPAKTIWHTGFTGTSLLISPGARLAVVLLTNVVHPVRRPEESVRLRAEVHRAVLRAGVTSRAGPPDSSSS